MRFISILLVLLFSFGNADAQSISHIEQTGSWYYIYDQDGRKVKTISTSQGAIVAHGTSFYILRQGNSFYVCYDLNGKRLCCLSVSYVGDILSASGDTFTSRNRSWIYTWDKYGKKINTRTAR
mgnify:CR=1 FL=1